MVGSAKRSHVDSWPRRQRSHVAAGKVVDQRDRCSVARRATTSWPEHRPGRRDADLLDVRAAEPAREHAHRLGRRGRVREAGLSVCVEHDRAHVRIVWIASPSDATALPHVLRVRDYTLSIGSSVSYGFGREMVFVAVGWQVYDISGNPLYLGLVGLAEFLPLLLFALPAGALADRLPRKLIYMGSLAVDAVITMLLLVVSANGADQLWPFLALSFASGCSAPSATPRSGR
jgi:hypothetical protein